MTDTDHLATLKAELNQETAQMEWRELQRFFASGVVIWISEQLDLIDTAALIATDDKAAVENLMQTNQTHRVTDTQARQWFANNSELWTVVVKPWVLVQDKSAAA